MPEPILLIRINIKTWKLMNNMKKSCINKLSMYYKVFDLENLVRFAKRLKQTPATQ